MKKLMMMTLMMCLVSMSVWGQSVSHTSVWGQREQETKMTLDDFYQDKSNYLIYSVVDTFDTIQRDVLITRIKNWAGLKFVNVNKVLVGETQSQLVFNYIDDTYYQKTILMKFHRDWYYRLIIQMKDDRVKISIYDDGNAFWPGNSAGPGLSARTYHFATYTFKKNGEYRGSDPTPLLNVKQKCIDDINSIIKAIQTQEKTSNVEEETW